MNFRVALMRWQQIHTNTKRMVMYHAHDVHYFSGDDERIRVRWFFFSQLCGFYDVYNVQCINSSVPNTHYTI